MKAITLRHPWPFAVCYWGKRIENRTWKPPKSLIGQRIAITTRRDVLKWLDVLGIQVATKGG